MKIFKELSAYKKNGLWKVIPSGLITLLFGMLYSLLEWGILGNAGYYPSTGNQYSFASQVVIVVPLSFLLGAGVAVIEIFVFDRLFVSKTFLVKVFVKSLFYVLIILAFLILSSAIANAFNLNQPVYSDQVLNSLKSFLISKALIGILLYIGAVITVVLFVNEVFDYFGRRVSLAYTFGKYHTPKQEGRIFMFMDLKSSTTIAEQLGHVTYFKWINQYYRDITEYILESKGDIYQYVGDEIIVTWDMEKGLENERCLDCFYRIKHGMDTKAQEYIEHFGVVPQFKAGIHIGEVTTGEIGMIKKDIIYSGDILNTTARIQASCNSYGFDLLVSDRIAAAFHGSPNYEFQSLGVIYLRGKAKSVGLYAVELRKHQME